MGNKRVLTIACALSLGGFLFAASPFATVVYAEGGSFSLLRSGSTVTVRADDPGAVGTEIRAGDIIKTGNSTFVEIALSAGNASIQIAENTTFKCESDSSGLKTSGELYYGRVRAKVAKLGGNSSFKLSSPSLVAGVRGTDFGLDVIAAKPGGGNVTSPSAASSVTLYRVFCFEGSVLVGSVAGTIPDPLAGGGALSLGANEMVERVSSAKAAQPESIPLERQKVSTEVVDFWKVHPFAVVTRLPKGIAVPGVQGGLPDTDGVRYAEPRTRVNSKFPQGGAIALVGAGTLLCGFAAYWSQARDSDARFIEPSYTAGGIMIGSGTVLGIVSLLSEGDR
jgi:hypothetical protein